MDQFQLFFSIAMDRNLPVIIPKADGVVLNLGAGKKTMPGTIPLDLPAWDADKEDIPYFSDTVEMIYAYHFLEHCKEPVRVLQECQRVLKVGGHMNICVPYYSAQIQAKDLDHKHSFCEETWRILFKNQYYDKNLVKWKFRIGFNLICGLKERNIVLLTQLIKEA